MAKLKVNNDFPQAFAPILKSKKRWLIAKGGRGSAKSWSFAMLLISRMLIDGKPRLCTRHVQKSIKHSSLKLFSNKIKEKGLEQFFDIRATGIKCFNGGEFIFKGMNDLGSLEGMQDAFIEEAQTATEEDIRILTPTIRAPGSQILAAYNPLHEDDYVHQVATMAEYANARTVVEMNWRDNPWFPEVLDEERMLMKKINLDLYQHIWEGEPLKQAEGAIIKAEYFGRYKTLPTIRDAIIVADTAAQAKEQSDYTVYLFGGIGLDGHIYLMDMFRGKIESIERIQQARDFWNRHKRRMDYGVGARSFLVEKAVSGFDLIQHLKADRSIPVSGISRRGQKSGIEGKFGRLMDVIAPIAGGMVHLPDGDIQHNGITVTDGSWVDAFISECRAFTFDDSHDHDDQVDCLIDMVARLNANESEVMRALIA